MNLIHLTVKGVGQEGKQQQQQQQLLEDCQKLILPEVGLETSSGVMTPPSFSTSVLPPTSLPNPPVQALLWGPVLVLPSTVLIHITLIPKGLWLRVTPQSILTCSCLMMSMQPAHRSGVGPAWRCR